VDSFCLGAFLLCTKRIVILFDCALSLSVFVAKQFQANVDHSESKKWFKYFFRDRTLSLYQQIFSLNDSSFLINGIIKGFHSAFNTIESSLS
jgi:hypothetical protein